MNNHFYKKTVLVVILIILLLFVYEVLVSTTENETAKIGVSSIPGGERAVVYINGEDFIARVVDDDEERARGLSGLEFLPDDDVMLFIFDSPGRHGIWMKEMRFSIDIIWLDEDFIVVSLEENVSPDSFPMVFYPSSDSLYVVELNSGVTEELGVKKGDEIVLEGI